MSKTKVSDIVDDKYIHSSGAVGVKVKWIPYWNDLTEEESEYVYSEIADAFFSKAYHIAQACGFDGSHQQGRSGGWVFPFIKNSNQVFKYIEISNFITEDLDKASKIFLQRVSLFCEEISNLYRYVKKISTDIKNKDQVDQIVEEIINL